MSCDRKQYLKIKDLIIKTEKKNTIIILYKILYKILLKRKEEGKEISIIELDDSSNLDDMIKKLSNIINKIV